MKPILITISILALIVLIAAPIGVYLQKMELATCKNWMFGATLFWFATAPFWMKRKHEGEGA